MQMDLNLKMKIQFDELNVSKRVVDRIISSCSHYGRLTILANRKLNIKKLLI